MQIVSGDTSTYLYFTAVDDTDGVTRETGLASFTVYRSRNGAAAVAMTTPTITEIDATNMPGVYALLLDEDTTVAGGAEREALCLHITHAGMRAVTVAVELVTLDTVAAAVRAVTDNLAASAGTLVSGAAVTGTLSTTQMTTNLTEATDDHYNGRVIIWTSGALQDQATAITDYDGTTKMLTFTAVTEAPADTDTFVIV